MMPGPYRCGCNPTYGQSCRDCDGTAADEREMSKRRWEWYRLHGAGPADAVYLARMGLDPRGPGAGDHLAQLRADRNPR
jgi:hypothetical protein